MRRAAPIALFALVALIVTVLAWDPGPGSTAAEAPAPPAPPSFVPELGLPATEVVAFGASPAEAPGEAWAYGYLGDVPPAAEPGQVDRYTLLEHETDASGGFWKRVALPEPMVNAKDPYLAKLGAAAGQSAAAGSVALITGAGVFLRDPGGTPRLVPVPSGPTLLGGGETVPPQPAPEGAPTPYSVYDTAAGKAGLFIVPYGDAPTQGGAAGALGPGVLDFDGVEWTREPIEAAGDEPISPLAIACGPTTSAPPGSGADCWLLARVGSGEEKLVLFHRGAASNGEGEGEGEGGGGPVYEPAGESWTPVAIEGGLLGGSPDPTKGAPPGGLRPAALPAGAQMLTATSQGVWVDFQVTGAEGVTSSSTELVEPAVVPPGAPASPTRAKVAHTWCFPTGPGCESSLGAPFPSVYRSFAWPGSTAADPGRRVITGLTGRATLEFDEGVFRRDVGPGGSPGSAPGGAAFESPSSGFIADGVNPDSPRDGAGQSQVFALTTEPPAAQTATEPVPFRRPLYAVAMNPDGNGEAIAVGAGGAFARFEPGVGWHQDSVEETNGEEGTGNLGIKGDLHESILGVSWPTSERAFAVGAEGTLWTWTQASGFWEPIFPSGVAPFNAVAFSQENPERGFAVGSPNIDRPNTATRWGADLGAPDQGASETPAVYTSVAFAGNEAIATYHKANEETNVESGGVVVENGSGWKIEEEANKKFEELHGAPRWPTKAAGLKDGGAVVAGPGFVLKRDGPGAEWQFSAEPLPEAANIAALGAYRDSAGVLRSVVAIDLGSQRRVVTPTQYSGTQEPLPASGYLLRETADGWSDVEHAALPVVEGSPEMPRRPEPVLGMAVSPDGGSILAVGGQTGVFNTSAEPEPTGYETSAAIRLPASAAIDPDQRTPIPPASGAPAIAIGGGATCVAPCADQAGAGLGPDALLSRALVEAREASGSADLRAFVYTGGRLESTTGSSEYEPELTRLASLFGDASPLPVLTTPSADLLAGGAPLFTTTFSGFGPTAGSTPYYAFRSEPPGELPLEVIVLDLSTEALGSAQEAWLREEMAAARSAGVPVVAVGSASPGFTLPDTPQSVRPPTQAQDPAALASILGEGGVAAYFFEYPGADVGGPLAGGSQVIPAIGTGTLGYGKPGGGERDWLGASAFLIAEVVPPSPSNPGALVSLRAIPVIESLVLHGSGGTTLAAGEAEEFEGLGRLPAGGIRADLTDDGANFAGPEPYVSIPFSTGSGLCEGANCASQVLTEYAFSSSEPEVGDFVNPGVPNPEVRRSPNSYSGFFCAKSPGTTTISITTGGLTYSEPIVVTEGENGEACRLPEPVELPQPAPTTSVEATEPEPTPSPPSPQPAPPSPPGPAPAPAPIHHAPSLPNPVPAHPTPAPSPEVPPASSSPAPEIVSPPVSPHPPAGAQPAPPTGVSPASQPVPQAASQPTGQSANAPAVVPAPGTAPARAREREAAIERQHQAVRVSPAERSGSTPTGGLIVGSLALLALAGGVGASAARGRSRAYVGARRRHF